MGGTEIILTQCRAHPARMVSVPFDSLLAASRLASVPDGSANHSSASFKVQLDQPQTFRTHSTTQELATAHSPQLLPASFS